jgi:hypothetical protein
MERLKVEAPGKSLGIGGRDKPKESPAREWSGRRVFVFAWTMDALI